MTELLTAAQMRAIERAAIESGEVTGLELMERAGEGVVEAIFDWRPELAEKPHRAVVLCGPGNNGGDGFVVARLLHAQGWEVEVFLYGCDPEDLSKLPPEAQTNARRWATLGPIRPLGAFDREVYHQSHLQIDAVFGGGLSRALDGDVHAHLWEVFDGDDASTAPDLVAIDSPSGLCLDSGRVVGREDVRCASDFALSARLTVTFQTRRLGHVLGLGPVLCGRLSVVDIGLVDRTRQSGLLPCHAAQSVDHTVSDGLTKALGHKYSHGHAVVLSGGVGRGGAARLAARGALRVGAGLVTVGCPKAAVIENAARLDAIMLRPIDDRGALVEALSDQRLNALCLGPGLGTGDRAAGLLEAALESDRALVLDADALTLLGSTMFPLRKHYESTPKAILLPHQGEFGRMFPDLLEKLEAPATRGPAYSKVDATREAAAQSGCVVLFKGPDTVIAEPSGQASVNAAVYERAAPWLATAGSGDVLAGIVTGLVARGYPLMEAAETGAWLHVEAARRFGPGLIAEDLPEALPGVFRDLGL